MPSPARTALQFDRFTLDLARGSLRANDRGINLRPKSLEVLCYLTYRTEFMSFFSVFGKVN
jgi:DNA-binding winged helix-turn-helix (wHTH) protein